MDPVDMDVKLCIMTGTSIIHSIVHRLEVYAYIDRIGGVWLFTEMALFMISILPTAIELTCLRNKFEKSTIRLRLSIF